MNDPLIGMKSKEPDKPASRMKIHDATGKPPTNPQDQWVAKVIPSDVIQVFWVEKENEGPQSAYFVAPMVQSCLGMLLHSASYCNMGFDFRKSVKFGASCQQSLSPGGVFSVKRRFVRVGTGTRTPRYAPFSILGRGVVTFKA